MRHTATHRVAYIYTLIAIVIMGPLLLPGYVLTLDMVWVPKITLPDTASNTILLYAILGAFDFFLPSDVVQKLVLLSILWATGYGAHRLVAYVHERLFQSEIHIVAALTAGMFAIINPFTYARFMDGHWQVLIGYAALAWIVWRLLALFDHPTPKNALLWGATLIVLTMAGSTHMYLMGAGLILLATITYLPKLRKRTFFIASAVIGCVALANLLWVVPALQHDGNISSKISSFDYRHNATFRTIGTDLLAPELNALTLHGYWGERQDRFVAAQHANPLWWAIFIVIAYVVGYGLVRVYRAQRRLFWLITALMLVAWLLALGSYSTLAGGLNRWLIDTVPLYAGYREPQKFSALLAISYSLLFGFGAHQLIARFRTDDKTMNSLLYAAFLLLPVLYVPMFVWGTMGQLRSVDYPRGWYQLEQRFSQESGDYAVVFLPWHHYIDFDPAGRTIANPAKRFFTSARVIQNEDPAIGLLQIGQQSPSAQAAQDYLIDRKDPAHASKHLARHAVKYIVIAKIADWHDYEDVRDIPGLTLVEENRDVLLYRNTAYQP